MADMLLLADDYIEKSVIGTALSSKVCFVKLMHLEEDDFYYNENKIIFRGLQEIDRKNLDPCVVMLYQVLGELGIGDKINSPLSEILRTATAYNFDAHVDKILDFSRKRKMYAVLDRSKEKIKHHGTTMDDITSEVEAGLQEVNKNRFCESSTILQIVENLKIGQEKYCPTGITELDDLLLGLFGGQLIVIGSRPGIGKSAIVLQIAKRISQFSKVALFSLEMPKAQIVRRMITTECGINANRIRSGHISPEEFDIIGKTMLEIASKYSGLTVIDSENKFWNIANNIKRFYYSSGMGIAIIDYLQLCQIKSHEKRYQQLGEMTANLKNLALKLNIPLIVLSQLSRSSENNTPQLSDLRESGNIEQDADVVILLHRKDPKNGKTELIVAKDRDGAVGYKNIFFNASRIRFESYEDESYGVTKEDLI